MKIFVMDKKGLFATVMCAFLMGCLLFSSNGFIEDVISASATKRDLPIYSVDRGDEKICAISFDAAWGNEDTAALIDILDRYQVKTTFFVVGSWVDKYPESVKQLSDAGHEIMNHSNSHPHMPKLSAAQMVEEIKTCDDKIEAITGVRPTLFRAPYGDYNDQVVSTLRENGHYCIQWDVDSLDWKDFGADDIVAKVTKKVQPGSIVLFHNAAKYTPEALPRVLEALISDGYKIVPVSELIFKENYTMDNTGKQILNQKETTSIE